MDKKELIHRIEMVCKALDGGITVSGVQNAGTLAGCYSVLQEVLKILNGCEIIAKEGKRNRIEVI